MIHRKGTLPHTATPNGGPPAEQLAQLTGLLCELLFRASQPLEPLLDAPTVAKLLQVDPRTVFRLEAAGKLRAVRPSAGIVRFDPVDVREFIDAAKGKTAAGASQDAPDV